MQITGTRITLTLPSGSQKILDMRANETKKTKKAAASSGNGNTPPVDVAAELAKRLGLRTTVAPDDKRAASRLPKSGKGV